ncbi:hypothetical protein E2C01_035673 [Portunus trituberculatus]|uniref:Uncharacterized protein n=1 Tax=Portunus trituberculatus TaxID=210409 RepID=A0A5B7F4S9_PORTR|nr:hypothetical protein [Portunus trituberculatus]
MYVYSYHESLSCHGCPELFHKTLLNIPKPRNTLHHHSYSHSLTQPSLTRATVIPQTRPRHSALLRPLPPSQSAPVRRVGSEAATLGA